MQIRRSSFAALAVLVLACAGCATDASTPAGDAVAAPAGMPAGSELTYATFNAYNDEPRATVRQIYGSAGSRVEGMDYQIPAENAFGPSRPIFVNRVLDVRGDLVRLERADGTSVSFEPPMRMLPFPLRPGERFRQVLVARESDGSPPRRVIVSGYVGGWETVKVPAGEFRALRVVRDSFLGDQRFYRTETTRKEVDWYAPSIGVVVRSVEDSFNEDLMSGGGEAGGTLVFQGDRLRWELQSVSRKGRPG